MNVVIILFAFNFNLWKEFIIVVIRIVFISVCMVINNNKVIYFHLSAGSDWSPCDSSGCNG